MTQIRRLWTDEEVAKLKSMAQKYPPIQSFSTWPGIGFRPHEDLRTEYLFANGSPPATDNRSGASGLDLSGLLSEPGLRYRCWCWVEVRCTCSFILQVEDVALAVDQFPSCMIGT